MIVTIANAKGGVAKTTTAVYLCAAHGLAVDGMGDAVLLDADVQASASLWRDMAGDAGVDLGFDVMPANLSTLRRLRGSGVDRSHGLTVVDAPPQGAVLEAAVAAADFVVVPASDSPLALQVKRSNAREGKRVRKGDLLFQLDTEECEDQIRQLEVSLREKELAWRDILIGQGYAWEDTASVPRQKLEFARVKSGYASTRVQYEIAVRQLRKTRIEAPSSGFIYDLKLYPNDYAKTTEPCCVIVNTERLNVVFYILEQDLNELSVGERIAVTPAVDKDRAYEATITRILPIVDENGMIKVKARITDPEGLWPGMSVMIHM